MHHGALTSGLRHELGGYREHQPAAALARFAEALWTHHTPAALSPGSVGMHRVLPDPALNLAFRCRRGPDGRAVEPRLVVIGPKTRPFLFRFRPGHEIAAVKVKLEWSSRLLDLRPADHLDREDELSAALPGLAEELLAPLAETRTADEAAAQLARALIERAGRADADAAGATGQALDLVRQATGRLRVETLARRTGVSVRQLRRAVRQEAAISLKAYARITRLNHAMATADGTARPAWARIAAESGFCDQSHLVRECRALAGLAPGWIARERRAQAELSNRA